ncbi:hypothetical protein EDC96DRAFT_261501 [Choanephora cucurbitarum]|nr:hypothetical protein EDC96DRAFT_261501 [Choanephora cucurbitarum]
MNDINVSDQVNLGRQAIENRLSEFRRNNLSEAELLLQSQLLAQIRVFVTNNQQHLQTLPAYQLANQNTINASPAMREYLQLNQLERRFQEVLNSNGNLFQQAEIICQQIALISSNPQGHTLFPKITHSTFWSRIYRRVAIDSQHLNNRIHFHPSIPRNFSDFDVSRKIAGSDEYAYAIPSLDQLHIEVSHLYGTTVI